MERFKREKEEAGPTPCQIAAARDTLVQPDIVESLQKMKLWDVNHVKWKGMTCRLSRMIAVGAYPFSIVEEEGFVDFLNYTEPRYKPPHRTTFSNTHIPTLYNETFVSIKDAIYESEHISVTSDIWTANKDANFISLTAHWISKSFVHQVAVLSVNPFPGHHTAVNIAHQIEYGIQEFDIPKEKVVACVTDGCANISLGASLTGIKSIKCFIHCLQRTIETQLFSQHTVVGAIRRCRNVSTHFGHSTIANEQLKNVQMNQTRVGKEPLLPIQDITIRWNSTFYMIQRALELRTSLITLSFTDDFGSDCISKLSHLDWTTMSKIVKILKPFEEITKSLSYRDATASEIIPIYLALKLYLKSAKDVYRQLFFGIGTTVDKFYEDILRRFEPLVEDRFLCLSTFLNPRFKERKQTATLAQLTDWILEYNDVPEDVVLPPPPEPEPTAAPDTNNNIDIDSLSLFSCMQNLDSQADVNILDNDATQLNNSFADQQPSSSSSSLPDPDSDDESLLAGRGHNGPSPPNLTARQKRERAYLREIDAYIGLATIERRERNDPRPDIFGWWRESQKRFPLLSKIARQLLSCPPTSVESERLFSGGGQVYDDHRQRVSKDTGSKLIFLYYNLRALKRFPLKN